MESSSFASSIGSTKSTHWKQARFFSEKRRRASDEDAVADVIQHVNRSSLSFLHSSPPPSDSHSSDEEWSIERVIETSGGSGSGSGSGSKRKRRDSITVEEAESLYDFSLGVQLKLENDTSENRNSDLELFESNDVLSDDSERDDDTTEIFDDDYFENLENSEEIVENYSSISGDDRDRKIMQQRRRRVSDSGDYSSSDDRNRNILHHQQQRRRVSDGGASFLSRYSELATIVAARNREEYAKASECKDEETNPLYIKKLTLNEVGR